MRYYLQTLSSTDQRHLGWARARQFAEHGDDRLLLRGSVLLGRGVQLTHQLLGAPRAVQPLQQPQQGPGLQELSGPSLSAMKY